MPQRALLVIDVQKVYTTQGSELVCKRASDTIDKINKLIEDAERREDLMVFVRHIHRQDGSDLGRMFDYLGEPEDDFNFKEGTEEVNFDPRLVVPDSALHIQKNRYSAFVNTKLDRLLRSHNVESVTVCGFMTNFCCEATARQAHDLDYFVDFVSDATGTPGTEMQTQSDLRERVSDTLAAGYARVWNTKRWCSRS